MTCEAIPLDLFGGAIRRRFKDRRETFFWRSALYSPVALEEFNKSSTP